LTTRKKVATKVAAAKLQMGVGLAVGGALQVRRSVGFEKTGLPGPVKGEKSPRRNKLELVGGSSHAEFFRKKQKEALQCR